VASRGGRGAPAPPAGCPPGTHDTCAPPLRGPSRARARRARLAVQRRAVCWQGRQGGSGLRLARKEPLRLTHRDTAISSRNRCAHHQGPIWAGTESLGVKDRKLDIGTPGRACASRWATARTALLRLTSSSIKLRQRSYNLHRQHCDFHAWQPSSLADTQMQRQAQAATNALEGKGSKVHMCIQCDFPVAVYGRIWPCLHAFCLCCASDMAKCSLCALATGGAPGSVPSSIGLDASLCCPSRRCSNAVGRIERVSREQGLFISPATLQSYRSAPGPSPHQPPTHICPAPWPRQHARAPCRTV
jgi:hypothetical protein